MMTTTARVFWLVLALHSVQFTTGLPTFKMAAVFSGPIDDFSWNYAAEIGRSYAQYQLFIGGYGVEAEIYPSLAADKNAADIVASFGEREFDFVIFASGTHYEIAQDLAAKYPNIKVLLCCGFHSPSNVLDFQPKVYQAYYLAGIACAMVTTTNKVGFLGLNYTEPTRTSMANSFLLGVQSVNRNVQVYATATDSYYDPMAERKVASWMVNELGIDCGATQSVESVKAWQDVGVKSVGVTSDMRYLVGETVLFSATYDWGNLIYDTAVDIIGKNFTGGRLAFLGFPYFQKLSYFSTTAPLSLQIAITDAYNNIANGNDTIFCGPEVAFMNPEGPNGCLTQEQIYDMPAFLPGIINPRNWTHQQVIEVVILTYDAPLAIALMVVTSFVILASLLLWIDIVIYRNSLVMKSSSPFFLFMVLTGCAVSCVSIYFWIGLPTPGLCAARIWLAGIGFSVTYGALIMKNFRIWRLFKEKSLRMFKITNLELLLTGVLPMAALEIAILLCWQLIDPYVPVTIDSASSSYLEYDQVYIACRSSSSWPVAVYLSTKGLVLVFGAIVSYKIKDVKRKLYNESKQVGWSIYNTTFVGIIAVAISLIVPYDVSIEAGVVGFTICIISAGVLVFIFTPKVKRVNFKQKDSESSGTVGTGPSNISTHASA